MFVSNRLPQTQRLGLQASAGQLGPAHLKALASKRVCFSNGNFFPDPILDSPVSDYTNHPSRAMGWIVQHAINTPLFRRFYHNIRTVHITNFETLQKLVDDPKSHLIIAPTHPGFGDVASLFSVLHQASNRIRVVGNVAAFNFFGRFFKPLVQTLLSWMGYMPVHRDANDLQAVKAVLNAIEKGKHPLLLFPEGTQNFQCESVSGLRPGISELSVKAAQRLAKTQPDHQVVILPVGIRFRYTQPAAAMAALERALRKWSVKLKAPLPMHASAKPLDRVEALFDSYLQSQLVRMKVPVPKGVSLLAKRNEVIEQILNPIEVALRLATKEPEDYAERCQMIRRAIYSRTHQTNLPAEERKQWLALLPPLKIAFILSKYDPDYARQKPSPERLTETLFKIITLHDPKDAAKLICSTPRDFWIDVGQPIPVSQIPGASGTRPSFISPLDLTRDLSKQLARLVNPQVE